MPDEREHLEVYTGADDQFYWRRIAENGEQVADGSEGYRRRIDCVDSAERVNPGLPVTFVDRASPED